MILGSPTANSPSFRIAITAYVRNRSSKASCQVQGLIMVLVGRQGELNVITEVGMSISRFIGLSHRIWLITLAYYDNDSRLESHGRKN